jgi:hypothetical protein
MPAKTAHIITNGFDWTNLEKVGESLYPFCGYMSDVTCAHVTRPASRVIR